MILIDTNIFLASIRQPAFPDDIPQHEQAKALLGKVSTGETKAIVSEIVLHECFYVLVMRDKSMSVDDFCTTFRRVLAWPGWVMDSSETSIYFRSIDILEEHPKIEFSDASLAARAEAHDARLATFDRRLAKAYSGTVWSVD